MRQLRKGQTLHAKSYPARGSFRSPRGVDDLPSMPCNTQPCYFNNDQMCFKDRRIYTSYSHDQQNVLGAFLFLGYIVAALVFSARIWKIIWNRYKSMAPSEVGKRKSRLQLALALALIGFSILSYNMLSFLILSYTDWAQRHSIRTQWDQLPTLLWQWMSHATLFEDFARSLVSTPARSLWTQLALLQTYRIVTRIYRGRLTFRNIDRLSVTSNALT